MDARRRTRELLLRANRSRRTTRGRQLWPDWRIVRDEIFGHRCRPERTASSRRWMMRQPQSGSMRSDAHLERMKARYLCWRCFLKAVCLRMRRIVAVVHCIRLHWSAMKHSSHSAACVEGWTGIASVCWLVSVDRAEQVEVGLKSECMRNDLAKPFSGASESAV